MIRGDEANHIIRRPDGSLQHVFSSVVAGTPNWSLGVIVPLSEVQESGRAIALLVVAFSLVAILIIVVISVVMGRSIAKPILSYFRRVRRAGARYAASEPAREVPRARR